METQNQSGKSQGDESANNKTKEERSPFYSPIVFNEYASAKPGQHIISVATRVKGRRHVIGKIFRKYDHEAKKYLYTATDKAGNEIFPADYNLFSLKKKFIENEKNLSPVKQNETQIEEPSINCAEELSEVRKGKEGKEKGIER